MPLSDEDEINLRMASYRLAAETYPVLARTPEEVYEFMTAGLPNAPVRSLPDTGQEEQETPAELLARKRLYEQHRFTWPDVSGVDDDPTPV